ncbi:MAG: GIY-YIG nuclease family protein [Lautropia sp.]|nr:GIY-YIG nuclease family protein [Lautropia sp.]
MFETDVLHDDDDRMLAELDIDTSPLPKSAANPQVERLRLGFEAILDFHENHRRAPTQDGSADIFERLLAVRWGAIQHDADMLALLADMGHDTALLNAPECIRGQEDNISSRIASLTEARHAKTTLDPDNMDDEGLLAALGLSDELSTNGTDINNLNHVRPSAVRSLSSNRRSPAQDIAQRTVCPDFERFQPRFRQISEELRQGTRKTIGFGQKAAGDKGASVEAGDLFILNGQLLLVVEKGESFVAPNQDTDARLRVIYDNGTESDLLMRSLKRALSKDRHGRRVEKLEESDRRISQLERGRLAEFSYQGSVETKSSVLHAHTSLGVETGTIYVLRSRSTNAYIEQYRNLIHKIGVTGGCVEKRVANAAHDPTYLMADVEIVTTYQLHNVHRHQLESLLHRFFGSAQLDISILDRFGHPVHPREWFLVPLNAIDEAIRRIQDHSIVHYRYDAPKGRLVPLACHELVRPHVGPETVC